MSEDAVAAMWVKQDLKSSKINQILYETLYS